MRSGIRVAVIALSTIAVIAGIAMRAWYVFHRPISSDEAIAGLMGRQILHGHFWTFYWGQSYGGAEPYLTAAGFGIFGSSAWVLRAVPVVLSAISALLTWRIARRLVPDQALALLAGALVWATPDSAVSNSFIEWGFRGVTLVCGLGALLVALRVLDGDGRWWTFAGLGLIAGVGWWSSPEVVYFYIPAGLIVAGAWVAARSRRLLVQLPSLLAGMIVGALPWLWTNFHTGFRSVHASSFGRPLNPPSYTGKLDLFLHHSAPMLVSLQDPFTGYWLGGKRAALPLLVLLAAAIAWSLVCCVARGGRALAIAVSVVAFPFVLAVSPATWYWLTGRYIGYVVPLYVMVLVIGAYATGRLVDLRRPGSHDSTKMPDLVGRLGLTLVSCVLMATCFTSFVQDPSPAMALDSPWGNPNDASLTAVHLLEKAKVTRGYANYWVAYHLDYLSDGKLNLTVGKGEVVRSREIDRQVKKDRLAAWIFVRPGTPAIQQFGDLAGPGSLSESTLRQDLALSGVAYRVVDAGAVEAVVPETPVDAGAFWPSV